MLNKERAATYSKGITMTRNLKILGLALMAVFAFGAIAASGASAQQGQLTAAEDVTLIGEETKEGGTYANALTAFPDAGKTGKTHCPESTITGHKINETPHKSIPSGATEVTLTPHYKNCVTETATGAVFPTTVDMNGCDYEGKIGETTEGATPEAYGFDVQIVCPASKHIQVTLFSSSSHALRVCTLTVTNKTPEPLLTSHAHVGNDGGVPDDLWVAGTFTNIIVHKSGLCGTATDKEGKFDLDVTVKGFNTVGEQINVTISH